MYWQKAKYIFSDTASFVKANMENRTSQNLTAESALISFSTEEALNIILNNLEEIFFLTDKDLRIVYVNDLAKERVRKVYGIEITRQTNILELASPERRPFLTQIYADVLNGKERDTIAEVNRNGHTIFLHNYFKPAKNSDGEIVGVAISSKDITEKKKADDKVKEAEERWRFALEGSNQGVWDWHVKTGDVFYSDSYKKMYGFDANDLTGKIDQWRQRLHPDDRQRMEEAIKEHTSGSDPYNESTYRIKAKDGDYKWIWARAKIISYDEEGNALRMIGTHTDITEQVHTEESYRLLYSNPLPMWTYDLETLRFLTVNDAAVQHYGYSKEEFLSMKVTDLKPQKEVKELMDYLLIRKDYGLQQRTGRHVKKNGEIIYVETSTHKLQNSKQNAILVVVNDITSKIIAQEELRKSNELFLLASRATSDAIWDCDIETDELHWGEGMQNLFGYEPEKMNGSFWKELIHPEERNRVIESVDEVIANPKAKFWKAEYRFKKADGSYSYVLDRGFIVRDDEGKAVRMIGSMQDISDRKYAEQILSLERSIFELSNNPNINLKYIVESLLKGLEQIHEDAFTSVVLLKEDDTIEPFVAPRLPEEYCKQIRGLKIGPDVGSCGSAMARKEMVIVEDISNDAFWEKYKHVAASFGLKACWSLPVIHSSGKVMGAFAIYYKDIKRPCKVALSTFNRISNILRMLMEHHWSLNEIKIANERFDIMMQATHDLVWDWNLETNIIYRDEEGVKKVYGVSNNKAIDNIEQWITHIHVEDVNRVQKTIANILQAKDQKTFDVEYRFKRDDGGYVHVYDRGIIIRNEEGKPVRMIGAAQDITARKVLEQELLKNELDKQKAINQATVDSQEQERTEIGKELHDNVNQVLTTTKLYLELALSNEELRNELIQKSCKNIVGVINEIRQLSRSLMDPTLGDLGLIDSLHDLIENVNLTRRLHVNLNADRRLETHLDKNHKLTIFRIIQEALNNAIKYARATTVQISFQLASDTAEVIIHDDGIGFDPASIKKGAGLKNIQNRVYLIGGTYSIESAPQQGCKIIIHFPIKNNT